MPKESLTWSAPEFIYYEKRTGWNIGVAVAAAILILLGLWQRNFLLAVFIAIGGLLVIHWGGRKPETLTYTLSEKGLDIQGKKFYPMEGFTGFAIVDIADDTAELVLKTKRSINTYLKIIISPEDRTEMEDFLKDHVEAMEYEETFTEAITRFLRF